MSNKGKNYCYFVRVDGERILIPMCYGSLHRNDLECCTCERPKQKRKRMETVASVISDIDDIAVRLQNQKLIGLTVKLVELLKSEIKETDPMAYIDRNG